MPYEFLNDNHLTDTRGLQAYKKRRRTRFAHAKLVRDAFADAATLGDLSGAEL